MELLIIGLFVGAAAGALLYMIVSRSHIADFSARIADLAEGAIKSETEIKDLRANVNTERESRIRAETELASERRSSAEKEELLRKAETALKDAFKSLSSDVLKESNAQFLDLAKSTFETIRTQAKGELDQRKEAIAGLVRPLHENLSRYEKQVSEMENKRSEAYGSLTEQVKAMSETQKRLEDETGRLVDALSKPQVRGYWGEVQVRRIVEFAGMLEYCDFEPQVSVRTDDRLLRPDMIINLPGGIRIIVDAKTPLTDYQKAVAATDEESRKTYLQAHARAVRNHIKQLSEKQYWNQFPESPDFVIMFIPGEPFYLAALQEDPSLFDAGVDKKVFLASPTSLIALLRVAALGWREAQLAENAVKIRDLGKEMYERIVTLSGHISKLGSHLKNSVSSYNEVIGAIESRVLVSARRFGELGVEAHKELQTPERVELQTRKLQEPEEEEKKPHGEEHGEEQK